MRLVLDAILFLAALGILVRAAQEAAIVHRGTGRREPATSRAAGRKPASRGRPAGRRAAPARNGGIVGHWLESRRIRLKHRLDGLREDQKHGHRMEEQERRAEHERERDREWRQAGGEGAPSRRGVPSVIRIKPEKAKPEPGGDGDEPPQAPGGGTREPPRHPPGTAPPPGGTPPPGGPPGGGSRRPAPQPAPPAAAPAPAREPARTPHPAPQSPPEPAHQPANGGTTPVTTPAPQSSLIAAGVEDVITAIDRLAAMARQGDIHHKRAAHAAFRELFRRTGAALQTLSTTMKDTQHYGPEMTEPSAVAAVHVAAAASQMAAGDTAIKAFLNLKVEELKNSGRQVPHHGQLEGTPA